MTVFFSPPGPDTGCSRRTQGYSAPLAPTGATAEAWPKQEYVPQVGLRHAVRRRAGGTGPTVGPPYVGPSYARGARGAAAAGGSA